MADRTVSGANRSGLRSFALFIGIPLVPYAVFCLYPAVAGMFASLTRWDGYSRGWTFAGFENFRKLLLADEVFRTALKNNLFIVVVPGLIVLALGLFLANALNDRRMPLRRFFQFTYLFPNILAAVVVAALWSFVYNPSFGIVKSLCLGLDGLLGRIGLPAASDAVGLKEAAAQAWLAPQHFMKALVPMIVWGGVGFYVILFLAGMQGIPRTLYEAARLDGANEWQVFRHVTWPGLGPIVASAVTFAIIGGMKIFDSIWVLTQQNVPDRNQVLGTYVYQQAFVEANMGYGTAAAVVLLLITVGFVLLGHRLVRRSA
jgi:raffinose/stachyose/melibiose transport system permease protein